MIASIWKIFMLVRRDFLEEFSYRFKIFLELLSTVTYASIFYFVAKIFSGVVPESLSKYGGDYFSFVLIGLAFTGYLNTGLNTFTTTIRNEQMLGTLEYIISTPTPLSLVFTARLVWNFIYNSFTLLLYLAFGIVFLSANYPHVNWAAIPLIMILSLAAFNGLGMISAGFILVYKRGDPINLIFSFASMLLGGVFFPVEVLPGTLKTASSFVPMTYTLRLMRDACIEGAGFRALVPDLAVLSIICAVLVPASFIFFSAALNKAKRDGSLTHY
ncbi:MAG TPA: ABC transporter permease [bacterium]|nr:ABC transporter permease [bacterium]